MWKMCQRYAGECGVVPEVLGWDYSEQQQYLYCCSSQSDRLHVVDVWFHGVEVPVRGTLTACCWTHRCCLADCYLVAACRSAARPKAGRQVGNDWHYCTAAMALLYIYVAAQL
jgi:hypothetical protein